MTKEELKEHCKRQVECCEMWARNNGGEPHGKVYEEHKLVLDLINTLEQSGEDCASREQALLALTGTNLGEKSADELIALFDKRMRALPPVTPTRKVGKWEYKQLGFRKYGFVCTSCGYAIHIGYDFNSMEEFKDMIETKLQNPHITKDKYCCKCGAEMVGTEND